MKKIWLFLIPVIAIADELPRPATTGALNPGITQENIKSTICVTNYTSTIRKAIPKATIEQLEHLYQFEYTGKNAEIDHLIPLSIGGHITDIHNLWLQPYNQKYGAYQKDRLERRIHKDVCDGKISLIDAQTIFKSNWILEYQKRYENQ